MTKLLIIIPTVPGNEDVLQKCIKSIFKTTKEDFNIVIGKNNFIGSPYGCNQGLKYAINNKEVEHVLMINDDIEMLPGWYEAYKEKLDEGYDIIGDNGMHRRPGRPSEHMAMCIVMFPAITVRIVGLLDEGIEFGEWEDIDYCIRAKNLGLGKMCQLERAYCRHKGSHTMCKMSKEQKQANKDYFIKKWGKISEIYV